jgi:hypothetical protein
MDHYSLFAQIALGLSVPVSISLFFFMSPQRAALITVLGGDLFLPELVNFKFPLLPELGKHNLPYVCVLIGCLLRGRRRTMKSPTERWFVVLTLVLIVGAVLTSTTNGDTVVLRKYVRPIVGLNLKDGLYIAALNLTQVSLPFFIGCALFRTVDDVRLLLKGFAFAALVYVPFALLEIRLSPMLHMWVYGYFAHGDFSQTMRYGGYRPMVFMSHGLSLARFFMAAIFLSFTLARVRGTLFGLPARSVGWALFVILIVCKSTGAIIFAFITIPILNWGRPKLQVRVAVLLASFVVLYPVIRGLDLLPTDAILKTLSTVIGGDRVESLAFRFINENILLNKARQRFLFGWGLYDRNFALIDGYTIAVSDGYWVIEIGTVGLVGFIATFGPALIPIFQSRRRVRIIDSDDGRKIIGGMALTLSVVALDWVPNGLWAPYPYMLAGALAGLMRELVRREAAERAWAAQSQLA